VVNVCDNTAEIKRNIALKLSYNGSRYHGWQTQKNGNTVQETLLHALSAICGDVTHVTGAGRTDAGVHAREYCANFYTSSGIPADKLPLAVNTKLPRDIAVSEAAEVEPDFNAILSCEKKEYLYRIISGKVPDPFEYERAMFYPRELDTQLMKTAAERFVGTHDFAAVRSTGTETKTTVRTIYWLNIEKIGRETRIYVCADGFLYNMVRAITGTLIYVSEGKIMPDEIESVLLSKDRRLAGPTVPPQGLFMNRLWYRGKAGDLFNAQ